MTTLIADQFFNDPNVAKAKELLVQALIDHQSAISGISGAKAELRETYDQTLADLAKVRGGKLFFPYIASGIGNGPFVELGDGSIKYDFINGVGVYPFGHSHPEFIKASINAALFDTTMQGNLQQSVHGLRFSQKLLSLANAKGAKFEHCFLSSTGVMAGENALKVAFQKKYPANRVLAFKHCFAGRTLSLSQITDKPDFRSGLPLTLPVDYVPFFDPSNSSKSIKEAQIALKEHIDRYPGQHAGMFFELILGEGGYYGGSPEFHRGLMEICKENNIAVLVDEVQTFARTEEPFAFQYYGLDDFVDVVWVGKASQVCATLFTKDFNPRPGLLSQTFTSSTTAIAVGELILDMFGKGGYFGPKGKIAKFHKTFVGELKKISKRHPNLLRGPYGEGIMIGITVFDGSAERTKAFVLKLFENGVISFIAGQNPTRVRFLIPVGVIDNGHIVEVCSIIEKTLVS